jgi:hypothetical protein
LATIHLPSEAHTTTIAAIVAKNTSRADLEWMEAVGQLVLIHVARNVRDVEVGIALVRELLELRVEGLASEANFVAQMMEAANAVLGILEVVILDKAKAFGCCQH